MALDADDRLDDLLEWIEDNKAPGFFIFVAVYCLATGGVAVHAGHGVTVCAVFFIPGSLLSLGAGFVFGIWLGALAVWFGATAGTRCLLLESS